MSEIIVNLKDPFDYAWKSDMRTAQFITLYEPTYSQITNFAPIKQMFMAALTSISNRAAEKATSSVADESDDESTLTGAQAISLMYSSDIEINKLFVYAQELFRSGAAKIDGEQSITKPLIEKISLPDMEGLIGGYIAGFIMPSLITGL